MGKSVRTINYHFFGAQQPPLVASREGHWCRQIVGTGPTVKAVDGSMEMALTATNEAQLALLYFGDVLAFDIDLINKARMLVQMSAIAANERMVAGFGSAYNATLDNVTANCWFKKDGDDNLVVETDDGTNDENDYDTTLNPNASDFYCLEFDFATRGQTLQPPNASLGRKSNVQFTAATTEGNSLGRKTRVGHGKMFDMSNYSSGLQPFVGVQKDSGTGTPSVKLRMLQLELNEIDFG